MVATSTCAHAEGEGTSALADAAHSERIPNRGFWKFFLLLMLKDTLNFMKLNQFKWEYPH